MEIKKLNKFSLSSYFFTSGLCFASWASRIPTIKSFFQWNDAQLGSVLLVMPVAAVIGIVASGWLVSKYSSRTPLLYSFIVFSLALIGVGFAETELILIVMLVVFSISMRVLNIAMNAQSIALQKQFQKNIIGGFHGLWSLGGVVGVLISTLMVKYAVSLHNHFMFIAILAIVASIISYKYALQNDKSETGNKLIFGKPDTVIFYLGLLIFFAAICEGGMFDWSGVYFKEVVNEEIFTYGYLLFMICMAVARFFLDVLLDHISIPKLYIISSLLIVTGLLIAIFLPEFWTVLLGFCLVGVGVSAIFPITYMLAGKSKKYSPGLAISIIGTYATVGTFIGPPLIGYLSYAFGLKNAFFLLLFCALMFIPVSRLFFKSQRKQQNA